MPPTERFFHMARPFGIQNPATRSPRLVPSINLVLNCINEQYT